MKAYEIRDTFWLDIDTFDSLGFAEHRLKSLAQKPDKFWSYRREP